MRICLQSDQFSTILSGIGLHTTILVDELIKRGHEVILICNEKKRPKRNDFSYEYIPCWKFDPSHAKWFSFAIETSRRINDLYRKYKFDIFHSLDARQGALACKKLSISTIVNINDYYFAVSTLNPFYFTKEYKADWMKRYFYYNFTKVFEKHTLNNFDVLIANSDVTKNKNIEAYKIPEEKIYKIHKGIPKTSKKRNKIAVKNSSYKVLMVGTNLQRKGIFYLIKASPKIIDKFPDIEFIIVGDCKEGIRKECRKIGVEKNFKFYGILKPEEVHSLYREADIFILPSLIEGLGISVLEAMSYGIPVITSDVGGLSEIIRNNKNGLLIPAQDSEEIEYAINKLLEDNILRENLSKKAFEDVKKFNTKILLKKTIDIYEKNI